MLNKNLRTGYAYQINTTEVNAVSAGSQKIFINHRIKLNNYRKDPKMSYVFLTLRA